MTSLSFVQRSISPGTWTPLGNPRGTLMKQADINRTGLIKAEMLARSEGNVGNPHETHNAYWQPTWDLYETGGEKLYGVHMGGTVGKICGNCVQDLEPIWATHMGTIWRRWTNTVWPPYVLLILSIWVPCVCHVCVLSEFISKSFSKWNDLSSL